MLNAADNTTKTIYTTNGITDTILSGDTLATDVVYIYGNRYYYWDGGTTLLTANSRTMYHMGYSN